MSTTDAKSSATSASETDDINECHPDLHRLRRNDPTLTSLRITANRPRKTEDWQHLGEAIATNTNLLRLDLFYLIEGPNSGPRQGCPSAHSIKEFCSNLNKNTSIRRLALNQIDLYGGKIFTLYMSQFLENNTSLTSLIATNCRLGLWGTRLLSSALARKSSSLTYLDLSSTGIGDNACQELVMALRSGHSRLMSLELNGNDIQDVGCVAIASLLKNPNSMLIRLYVDNNSINDEGAMALADGLANNKCLKTLSIHGNTAITSKGYDAFSEALCNSPNVDDILLSNHKIERFGADYSQLSTELKSSLRLNRSTNKRYAANRKVVMHHLVYNCNMGFFDTVPGSLVPSVLAMIADHAIRSTENDRTDAEARNHYSFVENYYKIRHLALHRIIRICPSVCERHVVGPIYGRLSTSGGSSKNHLCGASKRMRLS